MMQNETQNQNIDIQEVKEEAPMQTETPQDQNIGLVTDPYRGPEAEEPVDIDPKVTMSSNDLVGSDPKVTMNPEDILGSEAAQEPGFAEGEYGSPNISSDIGEYSPFGDYIPEDGYDPFVWESDGS